MSKEGFLILLELELFILLSSMKPSSIQPRGSRRVAYLYFVQKPKELLPIGTISCNFSTEIPMTDPCCCLYLQGGWYWARVVALKGGGGILLYYFGKITIEVPTNKTNVCTAGHDGPIRGFFAMVVVYQKEKWFYNILKNLKKKLTPKADLTRVADLTTRIGPTARSGPCRSLSYVR